jgi:hypothetical protein
MSDCDGGSFGGRNRTVTTTLYSGTLPNGTNVTNATVPLHFRGRVNLAAVVAAAVLRHGLGQATDVIVGGDSAGGLATYWSADWWADQLPHARVAAAPDSGYFFDWRGSTVGPGPSAWGRTIDWVVTQGNSTESLNQRCVAARGGDCAFPDVTLPFITVPLFVMQVQFICIISFFLAAVVRRFSHCVSFVFFHCILLTAHRVAHWLVVHAMLTSRSMRILAHARGGHAGSCRRCYGRHCGCVEQERV